MPPTVWITNKAGHDFDAAKKFGHLQALTEGSINPTKIGRLLFHISEKLAASGPEDFVLLSGHPVLSFLAMSILMEKHGRVNFLIWDAKTESYNIGKLNKGQLAETMEQTHCGTMT